MRVRRLLVLLTLALAVVSAAHASEDFRYHEFDRFGIAAAWPAVAPSIVYALQAVGVVLVVRGARAGALLCGVAGAIWCVGAAYIHVPEILAAGLYRTGLPSKALEVAVIVLGALTAGVAAHEWRISRGR